MNYRSVARAAALIALAALAAPARSQDMSKAAAGHCVKERLARVCPDAKPGTPAFAACMKAHGGEAMTACRKSGNAPAPAAPAPSSDPGPCAADAAKFCPGLTPDAAGYADCMRPHKAELSEECSDWAKQHFGKGPCAADAAKYCPGLTSEDGRKFGDCMMKKYDSLAPACQEKFKKARKGAAGGPRKRDACLTALEQLCPELKPDDPESQQQCYADHGPELPPDCRKGGKPESE